MICKAVKNVLPAEPALDEVCLFTNSNTYQTIYMRRAIKSSKTI